MRAFEEICVHRDLWALCATAQRDVPPCMGAYLDVPVTSVCPSKLERQCGVYCMNRIAGGSPERARQASGIPADTLKRFPLAQVET
jgi:hypothetical protein